MATDDHFEPWRKQGFICKPFAGDRGDGDRFVNEFLDAAAAKQADDDWTMDEVLLGQDGGGDAAGAPVLGAPAAGGLPAGGTARERTRRLKTTTALLLHHVLDPSLKATLRALGGAAAGGHDARGMWVFFSANFRTPTTTSDVMQMKAEIQMTPILQAVGFGDGSVLKFKMFLDKKNADIQPAGQRFTEHELCEIMLNQLFKTSLQYISGEALTELNDVAADWRFSAVVAGGRRRSMSQIVHHFGGLWDAQIKTGMISARAAGGRGNTTGSSTRVDGHQAEVINGFAADADIDTFGALSLDNMPSMGELRDAFVSASSIRPAGTEGAQRRFACFNCFGWDHTKNGGKMPDGTVLPPCAAPRAKRDLKMFVLFITAFAARNAGRAGITPVPTSGGSKRGKAPSWWRQRKGAATKPQAYVLEDGSIQNEHGDNVGRVQPQVAKALDLECEICPDQPGNATVIDDEAITTEGDSLPLSGMRDPFADNFSGMGDPFADNFDVEPDDLLQRDQLPTQTLDLSKVILCAMVLLIVSTMVGLGAMIKMNMGKVTGGEVTFGMNMGKVTGGEVTFGMYIIGTVLVGAIPLALATIAMVITKALKMIGKVLPKVWHIVCSVLSVWASPVLYVMHAQPVATAATAAAAAGPAVFTMSRGGRASPQEIVEDAVWCGKGYEIFNLCNADTDTRVADISLAADDGPNYWTNDSGAMRHSSGDAADATHDIEHMPKVRVRVANGTLHPVASRSKSLQVMKTRQSGYEETVELSGLLCTPALRSNGRPIRLFASIYAFYHDGIQTEFNNTNVMTLPNGHKVQMIVDPLECKARVAARPAKHRAASVNTTDAVFDDESINHARLVHFGNNRTGLWKHDPTTCKHCMLGGHRHAPYHKKQPRERAKEYTFFGQRVSSDIVGPFTPSVTHGFKWAIVFYDWYSGHVSIGYLKAKESQAIKASLQQYQVDIQAHLKDGRVWEWHTDGDGGFTSKETEEMCLELNTRHSFSVAGESNTNPGAERIIGVLLRPMRILGSSAVGDAEPYWPFMANQAAQAHNSLPSRRFNPPASPNSKLGIAESKATLLKRFRVMFTRAYVRLPDVRRPTKLSPVAFEAITLGWDPVREAHFVLVPELGRITTVRSISFDEREFPALPMLRHVAISHAAERLLPAPPNVFQQRTPLTRATGPSPNTQGSTGLYVSNSGTITRGDGSTVTSPPAAAPAAAPPPATANSATATANGMRLSAVASLLYSTAAMPGWLFRSSPGAPWELCNATTAGGAIPLPKDAHDALAGPYAKQWREAMQSDMAKKMGNEAWEFVDSNQPKNAGARVHGGKWAFAIKYNDDGSVKEFRARWVMKGFTMVYGEDFDDTYITGMNCSTSNCLFAKAASLKLTIYETDVRAAFTTAKIDRPLYMQCPTGFEPKGGGKVCKLYKSVEGGKSSGNLYYKEHGAVVKDKINCTQCTADPNLYRKTWDDGEWIDVGIFVDNALLLPSSEAAKDRFLVEYRKYYTITGDKPVTNFTGCNVTRDPITGAYTLNQTVKIEQYFNKYLGKNSKLRAAPVDTSADGVKKFMSIKAAANEAEKNFMAGKDYMGLVGCLLFLTNRTRVDCAFHVAFLAQYMSNPSPDAWYALLDVLSYMYKTRHIGITFGGEPKVPETQSDPPLNVQQFIADNGLHVYSDASWNPSHAGHVVMYGNGPVAHSSRKIKVSAQSSTEAEICAGVAATKDIKFIRQILTFLEMTPKGPTPLLIDNEGMWFNVRNSGVTARTRHFESWQHFVRDAYENLVLTVHLVDTHSMIADILTKAMPKVIDHYKKFRDIIMDVVY